MPFFTTVDERQTFLAALETETVPPGCWFRHAVEAPNTLDEADGSFKYYRTDAVMSDCVHIALAEIAGITKVVLEPANITRQPMFHTSFAALRKDGLEGLRLALIENAGKNFDPATSVWTEQEIEPVSGEAIQRWATLFAQNMVKISIKAGQTLRQPDDAKIEEGIKAAKRHGHEIDRDAALAIWNAMSVRKV